MNDQLPPTERRNPRTTELDRLPTDEVVRLLLAEDHHAVTAALAASGPLAQVADLAADQIVAGGRLHYFGAGASGRLAMLDATEITPTFGAPADLFTVHFPGGAAAIVDSATDLEDAEALGRTEADGLDERDVVVGVTASGTTPYVRGALQQARAGGIATVLITMWEDSPLCDFADVVVAPQTGPEALTGSTRLKAGTATKVILNALSTTIMVRLGMTYSNFMVAMTATNEKLRTRSVRILTEATSRSPQSSRDALDAAEGNIRIALVHLLTGCSIDDAADALRDEPRVRATVAGLTGSAR